MDTRILHRMTIRFLELLPEICNVDIFCNVSFVLDIISSQITAMASETKDILSLRKHRGIKDAMSFVAAATAFW
jgi:hypothetical protein